VRRSSLRRYSRYVEKGAAGSEEWHLHAKKESTVTPRVLTRSTRSSVMGKIIAIKDTVVE
jgi:hypothetical protein